MQYKTIVVHNVQVMHWNAQGITTDSAAAQLEQVLHDKKIDVLLLNETFLKPHHKLQLGGYKIYREDRLTHGGGVLIAIKSNIVHKLLPKINTTCIENISIQVTIDRRPVIFTAAYNPIYTPDFRADLDLLTNFSCDFFIFGDFNAHHTHWNCASSNTAGRELFSHCLLSGYYIYFPSSFTRFGQNLTHVQPSTVDILLSNSCVPFSNLETHRNILQSDHVPISCTIYGQFQNKLKLFPLYNRADWRAIRVWVESEIRRQNIDQTVITSGNVDSLLDKLIAIVKGAFGMIPVDWKNSWQRVISSASKMLIAQRNKYKRKLQRCRDPGHSAHLSSILRQLNGLVNSHLNRDRNEAWSRFISKLPPGSKKFWKLTKALKGKNSVISDLNSNGIILKTGVEKANAIAEAFGKSHTITVNNPSPLDSRVSDYVNSLDVNHSLGSSGIELTDAAEVRAYVMLLKNNKASGMDGINSIILKNMPDFFYEILSKIFNCCLNTGYFPSTFKRSKVIPIHKKGKDPKLPTSYRPISILSLLDKVFEKVIHKRLVDFASQNNIINHQQFGFRKEHSTVHQIKRVTNFIECNKRNRKSTGVIFLDIEKAFDTIWHDGLLYKLNTFNFPIYLQKIIRSFLMNRSFVVFVDGEFSGEKPVPAGLPQGSVLSPTLYSLYTSDVIVRRNQEAAFYADDSAFVCRGKVSNAIIKRMQESLTSSQKYFDRWKIKVNDSKTQAMIFPYNKSPKRLPTRFLYGSGGIIPIKDDIKYLGIVLDKKLKFKQHVNYICDKAIKCGRALYPILNRRSKLNQKNKLLLYSMCIRPILTYGCQVWFHKTAKTHSKRLQIIQNKNLKIIHRLPPRYPTDLLHSRLNYKKIITFANDLTLSFNEKCRLSNYETIRNLLNSH